MKTLLSILFVFGFAAIGYAQNFRAPAASENYEQKIEQQKFEQQQQQNGGAAQVKKPVVQGAIAHAAREGNVLQAINPAAPAKYGSGKRYVYKTERTEGRRAQSRTDQRKPKGLILLSFSW